MYLTLGNETLRSPLSHAEAVDHETCPVSAYDDGQLCDESKALATDSKHDDFRIETRCLKKKHTV
jgi:hypothetical protein